MRLSHLFGRTLREDPADADTPSHRLLVRAGLIHQLAAGVYSMLPLGLRVQRKVEQIIREEMVAAGAQEVLLPQLQPLELWQQSGRDVAMAEILFHVQDRREREHVLGPTHEEVVTEMVGSVVSSYRDLPFTLFQIGPKHRDETRARGGLLRVREFVMKDAYSFDADEAGLDRSYDAMYRAYTRIFPRCGIPVVPVQADSGAIGGKESMEFVAPSDAGEDTFVRCSNRSCGYAANVERAEFVPADDPSVEAPLPMEEVSTPGIKTIEALAQYLGVPQAKTIKAVFYRSAKDEVAEIVFVAIRGDIAVNEVKLKNLLGSDELVLAPDEDVKAAGLVAGSASPVGLTRIRTIVDRTVSGVVNGVAGGNRPDVHLRNVNFGRDFTASQVADIGTAREGDQCVRCGSPLVESQGIELGHVFKLGTRYTRALNVTYLDGNGQQQPIWMGCYGIGVGRTLAAAVEVSHDARGIVWPPAIAPYHVHLVALNVENTEVSRVAGELYAALAAAGVETLLDDRAESPGVKFNDADLLGLPLRVTVGPRGLRQGALELKMRIGDSVEAIPIGEGAAEIATRVRALLAT